jgi:tetratricopeptide (TPR) repeat protein
MDVDPSPDAEATLAEANPAAVEIALGAGRRGGRLPPESAVFLAKQSRLLDLQAEHLNEQRRLQLSHLKVRRWHDRISLVLKGLGGALGVALAAALGAVLWQAHEDHGLIIEAFSAPPDMASRGLTGQVLASHLLDKLSSMQAGTDSARPLRTYQNNWGEDLTVEIPQTGVSLGDVDRWLRRSLGRQTRISGEVYRTASGVTVAIRTGEDGAASFTGAEADLDSLVQQAAQSLYQRSQPYRYAIWLIRNKHEAEGVTALTALADGASGEDRIWANAFLSNFLPSYGDVPGALDRGADAVSSAPDNSHAWNNLGGLHVALEHAELGASMTQRSAELLRSHPEQQTETARNQLLVLDAAFAAETAGDYQTAARLNDEAARLPDTNGGVAIARAQMVFDRALNHDARGSDVALARASRPAADPIVILPILTLADTALGRWDGAIQAGAAFQAQAAKSTDQFRGLTRLAAARQVAAFTAYAKAMSGDMPGAQAMISATPLDCYSCVRMRGKIAAAAHDWPAAERWLAEAVRQAPSLPFAYTDWGETRLAKGDTDGAIAKLALAHGKGPHFADPLELWGEALMKKEDFAGAASRFREADRYAPRWGRNHLLWGQALARVGRLEEAKAQWRTAAALDLSAADRTALARAQAGASRPAP